MNLFRACAKRYRQGRLALVWFVLLTCNLILTPTITQAFVDPDPPLYENPPGPPFVSRAVNLPTAPAHQKFGIAAHPWWLDMYLDRFIGYYKDLGITSVR